MTTILKAGSAADFLGLVPLLLGFHPRDSLVLIPFEGSRSVGAIRVDLPCDEAEIDSVAATVIGMACRVEVADAVALVIYTEETLTDAAIPRCAFVDALRGRADACGLSIADALCVGADAWTSYLDPGAPRALSELATDPSPFAAPRDDIVAGTELPEASEADIAAMADALSSTRNALVALCGSDSAPVATQGGSDPRVDPRALASVCGLDDLPALFETVPEWGAASISPFDAAALALCLTRPALRDVALVQWGWGVERGDEALAAQLRWEAGDEYVFPFAGCMWGEGERPDARRLERVLDIVRVVAARSPRGLRAGPLTCLAWISWALGRSTHADLYARMACDDEPEYRFAELVRAMVAAGHLPDWAFRRV